MNDSAFDALLRRALLEAVRQDYGQILDAGSLPEPHFSKRYLHWEKALLSDPFGYARRKARPLWKKVMWAAACLLLAAGIAFGGLMVFSPEARAWVARVFTEWRETHTKYTFTGDLQPEADVGVWRPSYVPEGFEENRSVDRDTMGEVIYKNEAGISIRLIYMIIAQGSRFSHDNEHSDYSQVTIDGHTADLYTSNTEGMPSYLIWANEEEGVAYKLTAQVDVQTLIAMAESVEKTG